MITSEVLGSGLVSCLRVSGVSNYTVSEKEGEVNFQEK